jgi:hypothetical protein
VDAADMWDKTWSSNVHDIVTYHLVIVVILNKVLDDKTYILPITTGHHNLPARGGQSPSRKGGPSIYGTRFVKGQLYDYRNHSSLGSGNSLVGYGLTEISAAILEATLTFIKLVSLSFKQVHAKSTLDYGNISEHPTIQSGVTSSKMILKLKKPKLFTCKNMNESIMSGVRVGGMYMNTLEYEMKTAVRMKLQTSLESLTITDPNMLVTTGDYLHQVSLVYINSWDIDLLVLIT